MKEKLTLADKEAVNQIRRWPTLYRSAHQFFHCCVVGGQGSFEWHNGLLRGTDKNRRVIRGKLVTTPYPFRVSQEYAASMLNNNHSGFMSTDNSSYAPIRNIPDDAHKDWLEFIHFHLFLDSKITPELYDIVVQANCVRNYGMTHNPHSGSENHYRSNWAGYFKRIPDYQGRIRLIEDTRRLGFTPPSHYAGIDI
jgi:hypothetical protein